MDAFFVEVGPSPLTRSEPISLFCGWDIEACNYHLALNTARACLWLV